MRDFMINAFYCMCGVGCVAISVTFILTCIRQFAGKGKDDNAKR
jgi:hypothetical protein